MKRSIRAVCKQAHIWVGLSVGLLFCMMGLSGSLIVMRPVIEDTLRPRWTASGAAAEGPVVDAALAAVAKRYPDAEVTRISFPVEANDPYRFQLRSGKEQIHVYCDARTGEVLGQFDLPWLDAIQNLHTNLAKIPNGRQWTGAIGMGLFLVSLSGLLIWSLRRPEWSDFGRVSWRGPWKRANFELHRSTGLIANGLLLLISFTGMWMAWPNTFRSAVENIAGAHQEKTPKAKARKKSKGMEQPVGEFVKASVAALPGGVVREIRLQSPVQVTMWRKGDFRPGGNNQLLLDAATAQVLSIDEAAQWAWSKRIVQGAKPVHYAEWGGIGLRLLWCLAGLTPTLLFVSGFLIWSAKWLPARLGRKESMRSGRAAEPVAS